VSVPRDIHDIIAYHKSGDTLRLHILRPADRHERDISVVVQDLPESVSLSR
jgi:hypothetical protein